MQLNHSLDHYWESVRSKVCIKCVDGDRQGYCRVSGEYVCGLSAYFPRIVETVLQVSSNSIEPYVEALRKNVCAHCLHQSPDGTCSFRSNIDCGLDRYFPLIVEAIEDIHCRVDSSTKEVG
jgi:hypothetical protein